MADRLEKIRFDRMELAGSLGDLGTLLPLTLGMIVVCGVHATPALLVAGGYYIIAGLYFRLPIPVQPMKTIGAYAIAVGLSPGQITASGLWMAAILILLGATGWVEQLKRWIPQSVVRGVQMAVGVVLLKKGIELVVLPDPGLVEWSAGPLHAGLLLGLFCLGLTFVLLDNRRVPAALVLLAVGLGAGAALGRFPDGGDFAWTLGVPELLPYAWPAWDDWIWVLPVVVLPQLPTTLGNALLSTTDVSRELFPDTSSRVTLRALSLSMAFANGVAFVLGGLPMCHGSGGLAAHYRFGARTAGASLYVGGILIVLAIGLGDNLVPALGMLPLAVLGVLLAFAGLQLALMVSGVNSRKDTAVVVVMLGLALGVNLAVAFLVGIALAWLLRIERLKI